MAKRPGLREGMPRASRHEQGSYLQICCRQKGFLPFSNWTPAAPWVGHTKLPCCQRRFFSSGFLLLPLGFFTPGTKGQRWVPRGQRVEVGTRAASGRAPRTRCGVSGRLRLQILLHPQCQRQRRGGRKLCQPQHRAALCEGRMSGSTFIKKKKKKSALGWVGTRGGQGRGAAGSGAWRCQQRAAALSIAAGAGSRAAAAPRLLPRRYLSTEEPRGRPDRRPEGRTDRQPESRGRAAPLLRLLPPPSEAPRGPGLRQGGQEAPPPPAPAPTPAPNPTPTPTAPNPAPAPQPQPHSPTAAGPAMTRP